MPTRDGPGGIITIGDPSPAAVIRSTSDQERVINNRNKTLRTQLTRTNSSLGRISSIGDNSTQAAETRSSPGQARVVTLGDKPPVLMARDPVRIVTLEDKPPPPVLAAQATTTRPTPGPRPKEFQHSFKRRKLTSSE